MQTWLENYMAQQKEALDSIPLAAVASLIDRLKDALRLERQVFVFGNGGSACTAAHFITDLGKGASDRLDRRFRCLSLNDNMGWMTALGNDYCYEDIFVRQLMNYGAAGDLVLTMSVSGSSPNLVKAVKWAVDHGLTAISLVGAKRGTLAELAQEVIVIDSTHYGRVEDAHMAICHMLCYYFIEHGPTKMRSSDDATGCANSESNGRAAAA
jgi:D-sedoheptulose 7-phosphate isomerase